MVYFALCDDTNPSFFFFFFFLGALVSFLSWWSGFGAWDFRLFLFAFSILAEWESSDAEPIF